MSTDIHFREGFVKDDFAKLCEPFQGGEFLWTGRKPKVGQRLEIQVTFDNDAWCRVSGVLTELGSYPSVEEWSGNTWMFANWPNKSKAYEESKEHYGSVQGHEISVYGYLNYDFLYVQDNLPLKEEKVYKLKLKLDDEKGCMWILSSIEDVTSTSSDFESSEYPQIFKDWKQ